MANTVWEKFVHTSNETRDSMSAVGEEQLLAIRTKYVHIYIYSLQITCNWLEKNHQSTDDGVHNTPADFADKQTQTHAHSQVHLHATKTVCPWHKAKHYTDVFQ